MLDLRVRPGAPATHSANRRAAVTSGIRARLVTSAGIVLAAAAIFVVCVEGSRVDLADAFAAVRLPVAGLGLGAIAVSIVLAAGAVAGFSPARLPIVPTIAAQLASNALRLIAPAAVGTAAVTTRYLVCAGVDLPTAVATVAAAQAAQVIVTVTILAAAGAHSSVLAQQVDGASYWIAGGVVAVLILGVAIAAVRSERARRPLARARTGVVAVLRHARRRPCVVVAAIGCAAGLTAAHIVAFGACLAAAGGHASIATLVVIYLGAATAGALVPTPGGTGAVEAAMIAGLVAAGVPTAAATVATLLSRLVSTWLPLLPGCVAAGWLRRRGLL